MDNETMWVFERIKLYQLLQIHSEWSLRQLARELGHDVQWVRRWRMRIMGAAQITLEVFRSQSRARKTPPKRVSPDAKSLIGELRQELSEQFHRRAGPKTILYGLQACQKQRHLPFELPKARSTIARILRELGYIQTARAVLHHPLLLPPPMEEWEMDFGEIFLGDEGVFEFFVVIDRGTSRLVYLEGGEGYNAVTALEAVARLFTLHGLPKRLRFDRDVRLWGSWTRDSYPSPLVRFLRVLGVEDVICPPHRPDKKPFVERCIGTLKHEWFAASAPSTAFEAHNVLAAFPEYYNVLRPHQGQACQNQPPAVAFPALPKLPDLPESLRPDAWLRSIHGRVYRRRVNSNGTIQVDRHTYTVGTVYAKQQVLVHVHAGEREFYLSIAGQIVKHMPIQGLSGGSMTFSDFFRAMCAEARLIDLHRQLLWERTGEQQ